MPALATISPEAARIVATSSHSITLGLTVLDSPAVAQALAQSKSPLNLPLLRAATPKVIEILRNADSIKTPPLQSLIVLP